MAILRKRACGWAAVCLGLAAQIGVAVGGDADDPRPNFVIILADDLGYADVSFNGDPGYATPHLDRLAREGLRFIDFHSNGAVCSPTRAALMTGRYQQRVGVDGVINADPQQRTEPGLSPVERTFADVLQSVGYATGIVGKWHLGYEPKFNPVHQGFDFFRGYVSGNVCYISHLDRMGIEDWWENDRLSPEEGYTTHLVTRHAVQFIERHRDRPFCLYVAHECVHSPYQGPNDPPVRVKGRVGDLRQATRKDIPAAYREMMQEMDRGVGAIVEVLQRHQLARKTLVIFCSDNGATRNGNNGPLKGFKGSLWEGGHRVPCVAWQPGTVPAGKTTDVPALTMDLMPTILDWSGTPLSAGGPPLDGVSLAAVLKGEQPLPPVLAERTLFWHYGKRWAVRQGKWKLISPEGNSENVQLYDLEADLAESNDLADLHPELVAELTHQYLAWHSGVLSETEGFPGNGPAPPNR